MVKCKSFKMLYCRIWNTHEIALIVIIDPSLILPIQWKFIVTGKDLTKTSPRKRKEKKRKCSDSGGQTRTSSSARKRRRNSSAPSVAARSKSAATSPAKSSSKSQAMTSRQADESLDKRRYLSSSRERSPLKLGKRNVVWSETYARLPYSLSKVC